MAEHRARERGSAGGAIRAADLLARFEVGDRPSGHRRRATGPGFPLAALATPGGALTGITLPALALPKLPTLPALPALPSAQTARTLLAAVSTGAVGVTAAIVATSGMTAVVPQQQQPTDVRLAANPAAAAAAFALPGDRTTEQAQNATPVTGAELAAATRASAAPAPVAAPAPATAASSAAPAADVAPAAVPAAAGDATDTAARAATEAAAVRDATKAATDAAATAVPDAAAVRAATEKAANAAEKAAAADAAKAAAAKKDVLKDPAPKVAAGSSAGAKALSFAKSEIGTPYRYGATGPSAYDCSGLVMAAFKKAGISLPRTSAAQSKVGTPVSRNQLKPGDLVFFYSPVSHVGIYLGGGKMVHASTSGEPVKVSDIGRRPFHNARRV